MSLRSYLLILMVPLLCTACFDDPRFISEEGDIMLQVDATLVAGEPIDNIKIRRTFQATGLDRVVYTEESLWAANAEVSLHKTNLNTGNETDIVIVQREEEPGRYQAVDQDYLVRHGYIYRIEVAWEDLKVSAEAQIPDYDSNALEISHTTVILPDTVIFERESTGLGPPIIDTLVIYQTTINLQQETPYNMVATQINSDSERLGYDIYMNYRFSFSNPFNNISHYLEERGNKLDYTDEIRGFYLHDTPPEEREPKQIRIVLLVPENIYSDFILIEPSYITPALVTNVKGGVGLFFGAHRDTVQVTVPVAGL